MKTSSPVRRFLFRATLVLCALLAAALLAFYFYLRASRPLLTGSAALPGLAAPVSIDRDIRGHPTLRAENRTDLSRALGFLHAQERFFQMDLNRRRAAGELSALIGPATINLDRDARPHHFRALAQTVVQQLPAPHRALLDAYTAGVNAGLAQLSAHPFEYLFLRSDPEPWLSEDSILVIYAMALDLQGDASTGHYERTLATIRDVLDPSALAAFAPLLTPNDAALDASTAPPAPLPTARQVDLRRRPESRSIDPLPAGSVSPGSNALATNRTTDGHALLAGDPHLTLSMPNVLYRASFRIQPSGTTSPAHSATGLTLPGLPALVIGTNGHLAWTLTNAYADTADLIQLSPSAFSKDYYMHEGKNTALGSQTDTIAVRGEKPVTVETTTSLLGRVVGRDYDDRPLVLKWTLHDPAAINLDLIDLENALTVADALPIVHRAGIPPQNIFLADSSGAIAWTVAGKLPRRLNFDGRLPTSWVFGDRGWRGYLNDSEIPTRVHARDGQLWSGNQRLVSGPDLAVLGDGSYENPTRAARLRDLLAALPPTAAPRDLLAVQLDITNPTLNRWRDQFLRHLDSPSLQPDKRYAQLRAALATFDAQARPDSASYTLVRRYRDHVSRRVLGTLFATCALHQADFDYRRLHTDDALWQLLATRPPHFLDPGYPTWDDLLNAALSDLLNELDRRGLAPAKATWAHSNTAAIRHPFSHALPRWLTFSLDAPATALPGDTEVPRVQRPSFGASARFIVSPGREAEGILQTPGGQGAHPLSPYKLADHADWETGTPAPLLPGAIRFSLRLLPTDSKEAVPLVESDPPKKQ